MGLFGRSAPAAMLPASQCIKGRATALPSAPGPTDKHFIKGTPLNGPWDMEKYKEVMFGEF